MLRYKAQGDRTRPPLVFLHGFLGCKEDWEDLISLLKEDFFCVSVDLIPDENSLIQTLDALNIQKCALIGYSLGGRLALKLHEEFPSKFTPLIILSAHTGLSTDKERELKKKENLAWLEKLEKLSLRDFLILWYEQSLFKPLKQKKDIFEKMMARRLKQDKNHLAYFLQHFSISEQNFKIPEEALFLCGTLDLKYCSLYERLPSCKISNSGHAAHLENPQECALKIRQYLQENLC